MTLCRGKVVVGRTASSLNYCCDLRRRDRRNCLDQLKCNELVSLSGNVVGGLALASKEEGSSSFSVGNCKNEGSATVSNSPVISSKARKLCAFEATGAVHAYLPVLPTPA
eukprot:scaffold1123_cov168-Amphora_coffeaeformis.AAC.4